VSAFDDVQKSRNSYRGRRNAGMTDNVTAAERLYTAETLRIILLLRKGFQCAASGCKTDRPWIAFCAADAGPHQLRLCAQLAHSKAPDLLSEAYSQHNTLLGHVTKHSSHASSGVLSTVEQGAASV
jgi:hypothetical protein